MPNVLRSGPYRFYYYSHEPNEPSHVHVDRDNLSAKFWLEPVSLAQNLGFRPKNCGRYRKQWSKISSVLWRLGMTTLALNKLALDNPSPSLRADERVASAEFTEDAMSVTLMDGRTITVPLYWYPRLQEATEAQRQNWQISGGGYGLHWPDVDEDLSTAGLLRGAPAPRRQRQK